MVAHVLDENLQHVRTIRLWRGEFGATPPFDIGPDTLFVAYTAWAEMTCFMDVGLEVSRSTSSICTPPIWRRATCCCRTTRTRCARGQRKRLSDACRAYGIDGWEHIDKEAIARDIGEGRWRDYGQDAVFDYCEEDVRASTQLLRAQLAAGQDCPPANVERVLHWSNYSAKAVAQIQARGMPIDVPLWNLVQENKAAVIGELLRQFDPSYGSEDPIYTPEGEWSYARFEQLAGRHRRRGMAAPRKRAARHRRRRLPPDVPRARHRGTARAAGQPRRHRAGETADRPRRPQSAEPVSVLHRHRPQRARQEPVQRARQHALVHGLSRRTRSASISTGAAQEVGVAAALSGDRAAEARLSATATSITRSPNCAASPTIRI